MKRKRQDFNCEKDLCEQNEHPIPSVQRNVVFNDDNKIDVETVSNIGIKRKTQNENCENNYQKKSDSYGKTSDKVYAKKTNSLFVPKIDHKTVSNVGIEEKKQNKNVEKELSNGRDSYSFVQNKQNLLNQACESKTHNDPKTSYDKNQKTQNKILAQPNLCAVHVIFEMF